MQFSKIPLSADNQTFSITLADVTVTMRLLWRDGIGWVLDLLDNSDAGIILGIPLVTGTDLLEQHSSLGLGFGLMVVCNDSTQEYPTKTDLGINSHLYVVTELI